MKLESKTVTVQKSPEALCDYLSNAKNYRELMPENMSKFEMIGDNAFVFALKGMPEIALEMKEVEAPNKVVLGAKSDKMPFLLTGYIEPDGDGASKAQLVFEGDFNPMMAMMIKSPISKFLDTLTTRLQQA